MVLSLTFSSPRSRLPPSPIPLCLPPPFSSLQSLCTTLQHGGTSSGVGSTTRPPLGILVLASSSLADDDFYKILWLLVCYFTVGSTRPTLNYTLRGQSVWVYVFVTPLRPSAGGIVNAIAIDLSSFLSCSRILL